MTGWYIGTEQIKVKAKYSGTIGSLLYIYNPSERFLDDIVLFENEERLVCLDGVILNKFELVTEQKEWCQYVLEHFEDRGFPNVLRGSFSGFVYDKRENSIYIFTNHTGERAVFYAENTDVFFAASDFNVLCLLKEKIAFHIDERSIEYMLSYGFMIDNSTVYCEIKRLFPGETLMLKEHNIIKSRYHTYNNDVTVTESDDSVIEEIDRLFRQAVKREFDKDIEYGLRHLVDLSGGLDCRVVNYVARDMGYENITNLSYSQNGSDEYKAMVLLNKDLKNELIYYSLDSADFIYDVDKIVKMNYGLCVYSTSTGISRILRYIDNSIFGIEHGGLMGDIRDGAFPGSTYYVQRKTDVSKGMQFSTTNKMIADIPEISSQYNNQELFDIYTRGFFGGLSTQIIRRNFCDFYAPYEDSDFYDYFLSIPLEQRVKRKILQKWVEKKYPQAFRIVDDKMMCRINENRCRMFLYTLPRRVYSKVKFIANGNRPAVTSNNMNPYDFWYRSNIKVSEFIESYIAENIEILKPYETSFNMAKKIIKKGTVRDKTMLMTALSIIKQYG